MKLCYVMKRGREAGRGWNIADRHSNFQYFTAPCCLAHSKKRSPKFELNAIYEAKQCFLSVSCFACFVHLEPCYWKVVYFTYKPPWRFISKIRNLWFLNLLYLYSFTLFMLNSCRYIVYASQQLFNNSILPSFSII